MLIRHLSDGPSRDLELTVTRPDATVDDLAEALDHAVHRPAAAWVDGRRLAPGTLIGRAGLRNGSTVSVTAVPIRSAPGGHPVISFDGGEGSCATDDGTRPRNRTGRPPLPPAPAPARLPDPEPTTPAVTPIGVVAMGVSVVGAGVMVAVLGSLTYAAFAVVGPLMMVANTVDSRYRRRRVRRRYARLVQREVVRLDADLTAAATRERARRSVMYRGGHDATAIATADPPRCWERRPDDPDAWCVRIGEGVGAWEPPVEGNLAEAAEEVRDVVDAHRRLPGTALGLHLRPGEPVAVVGAGDAARALVRSLVVQAAVDHGPADLSLAAVVSPAGADHWDWLAWLPHVIPADGRRLLAATGNGADDLAERLGDATGRIDTTGGGGGEGAIRSRCVVVVDDPVALRARRSAARTVLRLAGDPRRDTTALVVLGPDDPVPASCPIVLRVGPDGSLDAPHPLAAGPATATGIPQAAAAEAARHLAGFDDPESDQAGRRLPAAARFSDVVADERLDAATVARRWTTCGPDPAAVAPIGMTVDGPLVVDLAVDGPHVLVAGTTGSGKSEALRSFVLSLAVGSSPEHLVFVLIDFKGGSAFDACADLPHTVGSVTDLDEHLAARALRCLEAELRRREEQLRSCGAGDLTAYRHAGRGRDPLPRLVVVVDEFAALAVALPTFVDSLVDVAQRGRSLGVHLVLATQRPAGAVTPAIQANIGLRIALRVQSAADSTEVIDAPLAADLPRRVPGRALVRFGPGDLVPVQVACASVPVVDDLPPVAVEPLGIDRTPSRTDPDACRLPAGGPTELDATVTMLAQAWRSLHRPAPRRPWPDPLPDAVDWPLTPPGGPVPTGHPVRADRAVTPEGNTLVLGLADDPDHQQVVPFSWRLDAGPLLGIGLPGSGPRTLAATAVLAAAAHWSAQRCHVHVIDGAGSDLVPLAGLPHVGAVVTAPQVERQRRLVDLLRDDLARRRAGGPVSVRRLLVVHGVTALQARWEECGHADSWSHLLDLVAEGSAFGIHVCCTAETASVPHRLVASCEQRLVFRLGDPGDHGAFGIPPRSVPMLPAGRALTPEGHRGPTLVHVARPAEGLATAVARLSADAAWSACSTSGPRWVGTLPDQVRDEHLAEAAALATGGEGTSRGASPAGTLVLPIGLADHGLTLATLELVPGGHAVVSGPPRSGRTTVLATLARAAVAVDDRLRAVVVVGGPTGPDRAPTTRSAGPLPVTVEVLTPESPRLRELADDPGPLLVLVDDADLTADDHPALLRLATERHPLRHVVATGRNDRLRSRYGHWTREVRADGAGLLLVPDLDLDGDLLGVRLPRRPPVRLVPGRAWLAGTGAGSGGFVQIALPLAGPG